MGMLLLIHIPSTVFIKLIPLFEKRSGPRLLRSLNEIPRKCYRYLIGSDLNHTEGNFYSHIFVRPASSLVHGYVITSHSLLRHVISHPCTRFISDLATRG